MYGSLVKVLSTAAVALAVSSPVLASPIGTGSLSPNIPDVGTPEVRTLVPFQPIGYFEQKYEFHSLDGGAFSGTFSYTLASGALTGFGAALYGPSDSSYASAAKIADYSLVNPSFLALNWNSIASGYYYVVVTGTAPAAVNSRAQAAVSGEIGMRIPEPSVIGLLGLGLAGIEFVGARRRS